MASPFDRVGAAFLPVDGLAALAAVRVRGDVSIVTAGPNAWVTWLPGVEQVWQRLLAVPGAEFFEHRNGHWYPLGQSLPRFDLPPRGEPRRLDAVLFPSPLQPAPPGEFQGAPVTLRLAPSDIARPTVAIRVPIANLIPWAEQAPSAELSACRAARCGERVILRGDKLPAVTDAERFWGGRVWLPLGFRAEPDLPETAIRAAAEASLGEILLITEDGAEAIPEDAFQPLTRSAARLLALKA
jgi:hypothetical protein